MAAVCLALLSIFIIIGINISFNLVEPQQQQQQQHDTLQHISHLLPPVDQDQRQLCRLC